jgi:hypothetical protein
MRWLLDFSSVKGRRKGKSEALSRRNIFFIL